MSRKNLIKSRLNVNQEIKDDISTCLNLFLHNKKQQQTAPFQTSIFNINLKKEPVKYKKNLTDWRTVFSQRKLKTAEERDQNVSIQNKKHDQISVRPKTCQLRKTKKSFSNNISETRAQTPGSSCRKVHSSFSQPNQKNNISPFDPSLTPFVIVQNIYESSMNNLETKKRVQTARIRQYYQKKAQKVQSFRQFERLETKINSQNNITQQKDFIYSGQNIRARQRKVSIYQRKTRRILDPNEFYRDCNNKIKIPQKFVIKQYPVEIKQ